MTYTLKPCPFCGHQPEEGNLIDSTHQLDREGTLWTTGCLDNEGGCNASMLAGSRQEAIDKWNTRAARAAAPAEPVAIGEYVLATKWGDGDPGDAWAVGFYAGQNGDRHFVKDSEGVSIRHTGYRRVGRVTKEVGAWLLSAADALERSPPGSVNLWTMLYASPPRSAEWVAEAMRLAQDWVWSDIRNCDDCTARRSALEAWLKS